MTHGVACHADPHPCYVYRPDPLRLSLNRLCITFGYGTAQSGGTMADRKHVTGSMQVRVAMATRRNDDRSQGVTDGTCAGECHCQSVKYNTSTTTRQGESKKKLYIHGFDTPSNAQYTPPTPTGRNCFVASASAVWTQFATSSRRLPTDSVDNLETDQTNSIHSVWLHQFW